MFNDLLTAAYELSASVGFSCFVIYAFLQEGKTSPNAFTRVIEQIENSGTVSSVEDLLSVVACLLVVFGAVGKGVEHLRPEPQQQSDAK
ncbi:hypothetical protein NHH03_23550 [Stieleria sp. TO1_6]|uniref:hypothetical protein n=1 Tax=Stieleria tagensis TaxID=2956795 RepID=UPI00209B9686|nr:hypothetical protein [Stieleria tagensis]MCO8124733.1 hypothetical protein [Stieleria tagensis]